jgi:hypothetical protein
VSWTRHCSPSAWRPPDRRRHAGPEHCDDVAVAEFLQKIAATRDLRGRLIHRLRLMIARGLGLDVSHSEALFWSNQSTR